MNEPNYDVAALVVVAGALATLLLLLVPSRRAVISTATRLVLGIWIVVLGGIWLFLSLLGFAGGVDGIDPEAAGWERDPDAWQRYAIVIFPAAAVTAAAWGVRQLGRGAAAWIALAGAAALGIGWMVLGASSG